MMKKLISAWIMICIIFIGVGCTDMTASGKPITTNMPNYGAQESNVVSISDLSEYTIVYPEYYNEYQMEDINFLKYAISNATSSDIRTVSDKESFSGKAIIIASSSRVTSFEFNINSMKRELDYIMAVRGDEIVIGGNDYYADVRAIYDFINNYIGYDDINGVFENENKLKKITGFTLNRYTSNDFKIMAIDFGGIPYQRYDDIKAIKDANFNAILIDVCNYTKSQLHYFLKCCVRCGIEVVMRGVSYTDMYYDCPIVLGHCMVNEPYGEDSFEYYSKECERYEEVYSQYGWQSYVNFAGQESTVDFLLSNKNYFLNTNLSFSLNGYNGIDKNMYVTLYDTIANRKENENVGFFGYVSVKNDNDVEAENMYRWMSYMGLCFGSKGINYYNYSDFLHIYGEDTDINDWNMNNGGNRPGKYPDLDWRGNLYDAATNINNEIFDIANILSEYDYQKTYIMENGEIKCSLSGDTFDIKDIIVDIKPVEDESGLYTIGCYSKKDGSGNLFILVNADEPKGGINTEVKIELLKKFNKFELYSNSSESNLSKEVDGKYSVSLGKSNAVIFTVSQ